jgi:sulfoxide reductase heme-binding subunit YedZ
MKTIILMVERLNTLLSPIENILIQFLSLIKKILLVVSFFSMVLIFVPSLQREIGEQAYSILLFILFLPIVARVIGLNLAKKIMPLRKELGILMGILAWVHGAGYISTYPSMLTTSYFWWQDGFVSYLAVGLTALIILTPLLLTSNNYAMRLLKKRWKLLHKMIYFIAIFVVLHIILIRWGRQEYIDYGTLALLA